MFKQGLTICRAVLATMIFASLWSCKSDDKPQPPVVIVEKPSQQDVHIYGEYVGRIRAAQFVELHARVEGYLEKMLFEEGKYVKKVSRYSSLIRLNTKPELKKPKHNLKRTKRLHRKPNVTLSV